MKIHTFAFFNVPFTSIAWSKELPVVSVSYVEPDGSYIQSGISTQVRITATAIEVTHGGPASGVIKVISND